MKNKETFHHALSVDEKTCILCTHCVKVCPTEAIRIVNSKVVIREERCVDCGECVRACPQKAFRIEHDDLDQIKKYKYRVVLFPAVFLGQFPERISEDQIYASLIELGFTHAYEVEQPIGILRKLLRSELNKHKGDQPLISSFCPAVVRLIQIKYPALTENIVKLKAPHDLVAHYVLLKFQKEGIQPEDVGIFYVTPCVAKIAAVKSPVAEKKSIVDGVINSPQLYNKIMAIAETVEPKDSTEFRKNLTKGGIQWSLTRGETSVLRGRNIAVDGIHNVIRFLERLENDEVPDVDFLELRACDRSCAAGVQLSQNRFLTVERLKRRSKRYPTIENITHDCNEEERAQLAQRMKTDEVEPKPMLRFGADRAKAMETMQRSRSIMCHLPGIDCAACGAPTCQALAEDIANHQARMSDCIFINQLWQKDEKVSPAKVFDKMEKKWGEKRFDPDCTKKGAKNEGF